MNTVADRCELPISGRWAVCALTVVLAAYAAAGAAGAVPASLAILTVAVSVAAVVVHGMQVRTKKMAQMREEDLHGQVAVAQVQLVALRAILDDLDYGIAVLDQDEKVQFINRAFRRIWRLPGALAESHESFTRLMYRGPNRAPYAISPDQLGSYVAAQLNAVRSGERRALDIRLSNGDVFQFNCKMLPSDGRLLTYENVSRLAHRADTLERLAAIDAMTGLNNRRQFLELAEKEWVRFHRYGRPLSLLMIDIDLFKSVNDSYGHDIGDCVIKAVAGLLENSKRAPDIAGRIGGEEFALMLPEATLDNACAVAERLRQLVAKHSTTVAGGALSITISIGASVAHPDMGGLEELIKQADVALYDAKRSGRDRVCRFKSRLDGQACEQPAKA